MGWPRSWAGSFSAKGIVLLEIGQRRLNVHDARSRGSPDSLGPMPQNMTPLGTQALTALMSGNVAPSNKASSPPRRRPRRRGIDRRARAASSSSGWHSRNTRGGILTRPRGRPGWAKWARLSAAYPCDASMAPLYSSIVPPPPPRTMTAGCGPAPGEGTICRRRRPVCTTCRVTPGPSREAIKHEFRSRAVLADRLEPNLPGRQDPIVGRTGDGSRHALRRPEESHGGDIGICSRRPEPGGRSKPVHWHRRGRLRWLAIAMHGRPASPRRSRVPGRGSRAARSERPDRRARRDSRP